MSIVGSNKRGAVTFPQGTIALIFIQMFSTLSFSVLYSTLVLYMTSSLSLPVKLANSITGVFIAINFALHLLGGFLGGRFLTNRSLFCLGMCAQVIGCLLLASQTDDSLYYGLAAFLTGCGLNVTCINCMLTQRFEAKDSRRETAFLWNYAAMNVGFFIGFSLSGYFQLSHSYQRLFLLSSVGNLLALFICLFCWQGLADHNTSFVKRNCKEQRRLSVWALVFILCLPFVLSQLLHFADWAKKLVLLTGGIMLVVTCGLAYQQKGRKARNKLFAFVILLIVGMVFWTLYQIGPMGLTNFIDHNVERNWLMMTIPPQWFQNINTLSIVFGGPALSWLLNRLRARGFMVNIPSQFACALFLIGLAFAILPIGIAGADASGLVSPGWIVLSFILQSAGELLISPIGYAMIGALAPQSLQGCMMGMWMLASGVGAILSSYSSNWMMAGHESLSPLVTNSSYSRVFLELGLFAMAASLLLAFLVPILKTWINGRQLKVKQERDLGETVKSSIIGNNS